MDMTQIALIALIVVTIVCLIVLTVFIVKFLVSAKCLADNLNKATSTVNNELEPVVKDLKETISGVNSLIKTADNRVKVINCALNSILGATGVLGGKLKGVASGLIEGFKTGLNLFKK